MATFNLHCAHCESKFVLVTSPAIAARQKFCGRDCAAKEFKKRNPPFLESVKKRLLDRMEKQDNGCILYTGQNNGTYGQIEYARKTYLAHRASYTVFKGEIPNGMCVCHSCDVPLCINPDHLWLGTYSQNVQDMINKKRYRYNPRKKLSDDQVERIRSSLAAGKVHREIAEEFGVSQSYISMLNTGIRRHPKNTPLAAS